MSDITEIENALSYISASCSRNEWIKIGMAIKSELGEGGYDLWDNWSSGGSNYNQKEAKSAWHSFDSNGGVTIRTLFHKAKECGYKPESQLAKSSFPTSLKIERQLSGDVEIGQAKDVGVLARAAWEKAVFGKSHQYLVRKKIQFYGTKVISADECQIEFWTTDNSKDFIKLTGELLLAPLYNIEGEFRGLQAINTEGLKSFPRGLLKTGLFIPLYGGVIISPEYVGVLYIAEGFATAATIREVSKALTVAALDAGNIKAVAEAWRARYPKAQIVIAGDYDKSGTGQKAAHDAALLVDGKIALPEFTLEELATEKPPSDFNDLHRLRDMEAVRDCLSRAEKPPATNNNKPGGVIAISLEQLLSKNYPPRKNILNPWLPEAGLCMVYANRGVGKTFFALEIAMAVACGDIFLSFSAPEPRKVLYIDGEMPAITMQERLAKIVQRKPPNSERIIQPMLITPDEQTGYMPNLSTTDGQEMVAMHVEKADLIIVDNISTLCNHGKENEADSWIPIQDWALRLRRQEKAVLFIHHAGKGGAQRGTSKREDVLDTVIALRHPSDYEPSMGACFEIHFEKSRGILGNDVIPIRCELTETGEWEYKAVEASNYQKVVELLKDDLNAKDIENELGISRSQTFKLIKRAKDAGDYRG